MAPGTVRPAEERPAAQARQVLPLDEIDEFVEPPLDRDAIAQEDEKRNAEGLPPRYAIAHKESITPSGNGTWEQLDDATMLWRLRISSLDATSINLGFTRYKMPEGGRLMIYAADFSHVIRSFTHADNSAHGELWTPPVAGEHLIVELTIPIQMVPLLELELGSVNIGYRPFMIPPELVSGEPEILSGGCNIDVLCPQGVPWQSQIQSVGVISTGGETLCTGFMVNNTANDLKPYFMTANHCLDAASEAASLIVFWNYQNSFCRPPGSPQSGQPGDGSLNTFQSGAFLRATAAVSDFTLLELDESPNPAWNISFAGWSREDQFPSGGTPMPPPNGACIHHPSTDEKRITFFDIADRPDRPAHASSWGCSPFPGPGDSSHIRVYWRLEGAVTEPGSSGSPLFDENKRAIGQLHGGPSACGQTGDGLSDCYGRIWRSWSGGGSSSTRLSDWLDTTNSGALVTDTISGGGLNVLPGTGVTHVGVVGGPFTNPSTNYNINNQTASSANYTVSLVSGGTAPIRINGGTAPISGAVPSGGPPAVITVTLDKAATNSLPAGIYTTTVRFHDTTNNITADRVHRLEVGQTGFNTTPTNGLASGGPTGGPFNATQVYTLTSTQPTTVYIQISASQPWISINGGAGPLTVNLSGVGASTTVTIGYSATANNLPNGLYNGIVSFTNQSAGAGSTTRPVQLDVGRYSYPSSDTPQPINDFSSITSVINVPDTYCIADLNVEVNITHSYIGDLIVELTSPGGVVVRLHNRTGNSKDNLYRLYDDGVVNPDGPGVLADFSGAPVSGNWTLMVSDNANSDTGSLDNWTLKIASGACAPPQMVHSYRLDSNPGWSTQGGWAYGQPLGYDGDPSAGYTGGNVYGYNLAGAYGDSMPAGEYLISSAINCSGLSNTKLRFRRWLGVEHSTYDHAMIDVSNNGTTWTSLWSNPAGSGNSIVESAWSYQSFNIGAIADNQSTVYIRWGLGPTDGSVTYGGWNIDDIEIWASVPCTMPGDMNNDGRRDGGDIGVFTKALLNPAGATAYELCAADVLDDNSVNLGDVGPFVNLLLGQ